VDAEVCTHSVLNSPEKGMKAWTQRETRSSQKRS
jgi:hypothetical protein